MARLVCEGTPSRGQRERGYLVGHRATHYALDALLRGVPVADSIATPFTWQPGWAYELT